MRKQQCAQITPNDCAKSEGTIEGFHDAVRTPHALRPGRHVGFFLEQQICFNFVSILFETINLTVSECTYIIVPMV